METKTKEQIYKELEEKGWEPTREDIRVDEHLAKLGKQEKCAECKDETRIPGMWICADCYTKITFRGEE